VLPRALSVIAWTAVTCLATAIGFLAISTVGEVLRGSGPIGEDFSIAEHSAPLPARPVTATLHHPLATLTAHCAGRAATLLGVEPAAGATVLDTDKGPDEDVHIDVTDRVHTLRLEVYCNRGQPRLVIEAGT
jgi:hypothetical protein